MQRIHTIEGFRKSIEEQVRTEDLLADLKPPHHFEHARFNTYQPDPNYPNQAQAVEELRVFVHGITKTPAFFSRILKLRPVSGRGIYLDGGFGVGKTHLLASAYHAFHGPKAFLSFQELMFLVGLQKLEQTAKSLDRYKLLVIDEFELDDPANTRIATNLLTKLLSSGVSIVTSSNTPPGALGEGRFSIDGFRREMSALFDRFAVLRLHGEDYRRQHPATFQTSSRWIVGEGGRTSAPANPANFSVTFSELLHLLSLAHPIRVRKALGSLASSKASLDMTEVTPITDPFAALRFVYFIDKAYDMDLPLRVFAEVPIDELFSPSIYRGGDTKKYLRTMSRLREITL